MGTALLHFVLLQGHCERGCCPGHAAQEACTSGVLLKYEQRPEVESMSGKPGRVLKLARLLFMLLMLLTMLVVDLLNMTLPREQTAMQCIGTSHACFILSWAEAC